MPLSPKMFVFHALVVQGKKEINWLGTKKTGYKEENNANMLARTKFGQTKLLIHALGSWTTSSCRTEIIVIVVYESVLILCLVKTLANQIENYIFYF